MSEWKNVTMEEGKDMAEYIEREALLTEIAELHMKHKLPDNEEMIFSESDIRGLVLCLPAAEVEPVVRCGECKFWEPHCSGKAGICPKRRGVAKEDDFCSYGERKEE